MIMTTNEFTSPWTETTVEEEEERSPSCCVLSMKRLKSPGSPFRFAIPVYQIKKSPQNIKKTHKITKTQIRKITLRLLKLKIKIQSSQRLLLSSLSLSHSLTHSLTHFFVFSLSLTLYLSTGEWYYTASTNTILEATFLVCFLVGSSRIEVGNFSFYSNCFLESWAEWVVHEDSGSIWAVGSEESYGGELVRV